MSSVFRLIRIFHCIGKYRLLDLAPKHGVFRYRALLFPMYLYPKRKQSRGERLRLALEELGPIFIKFGQLLSTRPDLLPDDLISELTLLQDRVSPFDAEHFTSIVERSLGASIDSLFADYEHRPLASASIAQVHGATLKDGSRVVIKVVRPGIDRIIEQDTRLLALLARWVEALIREGRRLRPVEVVEDYRNTIVDELDLIKEGANAAQLRRNFEGSSKLYIPEVHWEYTRRNVLVMERIKGIPVNDIKALKAQNTNLKLLAERGVEIFFKQVFEHNFFHADMHPGNVFVSHKTPESPSYIAIDMAIVGSLSREDQYYLARNLIAMFRRDYRQVAELHVLSGWVPENTSIAAFESAIRAVCEPIFQKPLKDISFGEALITLFRTAQRFNMPVQPQLVLLQKTLLNIEGLGRQLYPELDLWQTAHPFLERWLKERYHPKALWQDLKYHAPEWIEKFPLVPGMIFDTIAESKRLAESAPELRAFSQSYRREQRYRRLRRLSLGCVLSLGAVSVYTLVPATMITANGLAASVLLVAALITALV